MAVAEGCRQWLAVKPRLDDLRHIGALLFCRRRNARHRLTVLLIDGGRITDDEDVSIIFQIEMRPNNGASCPVGSGIEPLRGG
ncbi:hypothetical protein D3C72_2307850 [compost metagenome]